MGVVPLPVLPALGIRALFALALNALAVGFIECWFDVLPLTVLFACVLVLGFRSEALPRGWAVESGRFLLGMSTEARDQREKS